MLTFYKSVLNTLDRINYIDSKTGKVNYSAVSDAILMQPNKKKLN
jgi:hypothetical protein